jgi:hypothetical protein
MGTSSNGSACTNIKVTELVLTFEYLYRKPLVVTTQTTTSLPRTIERSSFPNFAQLLLLCSFSRLSVVNPNLHLLCLQTDLARVIFPVFAGNPNTTTDLITIVTFKVF